MTSCIVLYTIQAQARQKVASIDIERANRDTYKKHKITGKNERQISLCSFCLNNKNRHTFICSCLLHDTKIKNIAYGVITMFNT